MKALTPHVSEAIKRLKAGPDFAMVLTWLDDVVADSKALAVQPLTPTDAGREHLAGQAFGVEQITKKIRQVWEADRKEPKQ